MGHDVFLSFSSKDQQIADAVYKHLTGQNITCWYSKESIKGGGRYFKDIESAISGSKILVLIYSSSALQSPHINAEVDQAFSESKIIIPYQIENVPLNSNFRYFLRSYQFIPAYSTEETEAVKLKRLIECLKERLKEMGVHSDTLGFFDLTVIEQKYVNKLNKFLEDRNITDAERDRLKEAAQDFEISAERANELEEQVKKELGLSEQAQLNLNEQKYLNKLRKVLEDKEITDDERQRLAEWMEDFDIPPTLAKELEEQVKKELGIVELMPVPGGITSEIVAEEGALRDIAEHFVDELNKKYESHLKAMDLKFELDPNGLKIMLDYSVGYSCKFVFEFQKEFMNCSLWDWCRNEPPISGSKDFFGKWFDNECANDFTTYEWNKRRLYGYLVFWTEDFSSEASEPQLFIDFKKRTSSTLDILLPKLEKLYNESAGTVGALAKLRDFIDNTVVSLKQVFPQEEGWTINQNAKSLSQWSGISIYKSVWEGKANFRMESWNGHFDKLFFGLKRGEWEYTFQSLSDDELNNKLNGWFGEGTKDGWFFYWNWIDEKYRNTGGLEFSISQEQQNEFIAHYVDVFKKMKAIAPLIDDALSKAETVRLPPTSENSSSAMEFEDFAEKFYKLKNGLQQIHSDYLENNKTEAADFNIFHLLGVAHLEVSTHSSMLRELLDSNGSHGQGNMFFVEFLSMLADKNIIPKEDIHKYSPKTFDNYVCEAERSVATGRVDIIIERLHGDFPFCIIIENKVYAVDQYKQIERYWEELEKKTQIPLSRKEIIYLTPNGCRPSEDSIDCQTRGDLESKGALHYLSYNHDIKQWLEGVLPKVKSPKVEGMLRHYIEIVKDL